MHLDPGNRTLRVWLGEALLGDGREYQAISTLERATRIDFENENLDWRFFRLASALRTAGEDQQADFALGRAQAHAWRG